MLYCTILPSTITYYIVLRIILYYTISFSIYYLLHIVSYYMILFYIASLYIVYHISRDGSLRSICVVSEDVAMQEAPGEGEVQAITQERREFRTQSWFLGHVHGNSSVERRRRRSP